MVPSKTFHLGFACSLMITSCGKDDKKGNSANLPHLTPAVRSATPVGLTTSLALNSSLDGMNARFFNSEGGPSNIFNILADIDKTIDSINTITAGDEKACRSQEPVAYTINPLGDTVTFYAQCYQTLAAGAIASAASFHQYGVKDGIIYLYSKGTVGEFAAIATPVDNATDQYAVKAWITVGGGNSPSWDSGSYGIMQLTANPNTRAFEFTVAGIGLGYCGAQLKSDGANIFATHSVDRGEICGEPEDLCLNANTLAVSPECTGSLQAFTLRPIGRDAAVGAHISGASQYPSPTNVSLKGTDTDSLHFGPTAAIAGVGSL